jgi:hypothetical protein
MLFKPAEPARILLRGFSAFYVAKSMPQIPDQPRNYRLKPLRRGLYGLSRTTNSAQPIPQPISPTVLTLVPRRTVTSVSRSRRRTPRPAIRRFVLIAYTPLNDPTQRQTARRLAWRTPIIRLKPGLLLAPQIRAARFRSYQPALLRPGEYVRRLVEMGATAWYAPRLELPNDMSKEIFHRLVRRTFEERAKGIIKACRHLYREAAHWREIPNWPAYSKQRLVTIRMRLRRLRALMRFFAREFEMDFGYATARAAAAASRVRLRLKLSD